MNKLYKNSKDGKFLGVCQGISDCISIDPTIIRLIFIIGAFCGGTSVVLYVIMALLLDEKPVV